MTSIASATIHQNVVPSEVGWQFVPQYYTFVNKEPHRLHCFYTKTSTFLHGTEGEDEKPCYGQQEIHSKITSIGFQDCKVYIHSVDAQSSANGGIIIQVIGEMSNRGEPWRKFVQTFFLAEQTNGYYVLNDIFRFLKDETVESENEETTEAESTTEPEPVPAPALAPEPVYEAPRQPTPPPPRAATPPTPSPIEEPPAPEPPAKVPTPAPEPAPQPPTIVAPEPVLSNDTSEPEKPAASAPEKAAAPSPTPSTPAKAPSPAPPAATTSVVPSPAPAAQQSLPVVVPIPAPAPAPAPTPAAPPVPRTWASLAATNSKKWGPTVAEGRGITETPSNPTPPVNIAPAPAQRGPPQQHHAYAAAQSITTPQCFIKGVTDNITTAALQKQLGDKFGPLKDLDVVRSKACAFLEFASLDSAKRAIIASLNQGQGGDGGVYVDVGEAERVRIIIETKKERSERPPTRGRGGAPGQGDRDKPQGINGGGYRGRGGPRGRGAPPK